VRFSWWFTSLRYKFLDGGAFGQKIQKAEIGDLLGSATASTALAENYVGLPLKAWACGHGSQRQGLPRP
jgi:p-hydroxybenzoate 3-monooxygenase